MTDRKPILCLDFDGVCHLYTSGWQGADIIPDPPTPGLFAFLERVAPYYEIHVFSSRSHQPGGIEAMTHWFAEYYRLWRGAGGHVDLVLKFPKEKPAAQISIDDRALTFTGVWPALEQLRSFRPWNKR